MRILALGFAVLTVTVWWWPLDKAVQSVDMAFVCFTILALRSAWKRLDVVRKAAGQGPGGVGQ